MVSIEREEILIKKTIAHEKDLVDYFASGINLKMSTVEYVDGKEYVVLRSSTGILSVLLVDGWQIERQGPENWFLGNGDIPKSFRVMYGSLFFRKTLLCF